MTILEFQPTPNPNALKCVVAGTIPAGPASTAKPRSYASADAAACDPLAAAIFRVAGVRNVLIADTWLTVGKEASTPWPSLKQALQQAVAAL